MNNEGYKTTECVTSEFVEYRFCNKFPLYNP